ncbi:FmdB family zinc ribbon protein [Enemella sp. A6]|uniref:FmdB family zinc ribbon protein n=1 Tax=Enemella sp. A6 TaxID=3440152 RepID=UPI003EBF913E
MPTYQYRCTSCGNELEAVQKFTDPALTECPACEGALRKIYNAVGVVFKGSGFYKTDSRNDGKAKSVSSGKSESSSDSSSSGSSGSDTGSSSTPAAAGSSAPAKSSAAS